MVYYAVNTGRAWIQKITGSDCTKRQLHQMELLSGTTATRRRTESGGEVNRMTELYASVIRRTDLATDRVTTAITTHARNVQVG